tara:strand:+ start:827 stop:982 length:156 start_codon:yes stop_codon:yes gene_type:complete
MARGINYKPTEDNRKFLEKLQKEHKAFRGLSQIINKIVTDMRLKTVKNPFN